MIDLQVGFSVARDASARRERLARPTGQGRPAQIKKGRFKWVPPEKDPEDFYERPTRFDGRLPEEQNFAVPK